MKFHKDKQYLFRVKRPILWFASSQAIATNGLHKYFTDEGIESLINDGFIEIISEIIPKIIADGKVGN